MRSALGGLSVLLAVTAAGSAWADNYPARPLNWIVPLAAGGPADTLARTVADKLAGQLKATIVIENVAGAGGTIGATKAASNPADGYHFVVGHMGFMGAGPALYKSLRYDPVKDFTAVVRFPDTPAVLLVGKDSKYQTLADLVQAARNSATGLTFGTAGVGSVSHLVAELFASELGVKIQSVPYRGNAPALADLMAGRLDAVFDQSNTAGAAVAGGRVRERPHGPVPRRAAHLQCHSRIRGHDLVRLVRARRHAGRGGPEDQPGLPEDGGRPRAASPALRAWPASAQER